MADDRISFQQGALAVFDQDSGAEANKISRFIPFRFNPEDLNRQLSIEQAQGQGALAGTGTAATSSGGGNSADQGADADSGSLKEAFSLLLRFDLAYREERANNNMPVEYGILPEISALEDLLHPTESQADQPSDGSEPTRARGRRPLVLFVWGERRVVPVKITGMTINEQFFNGQLYPTRAEIEVALETLGEGDARDNTRVASSLKFTADNRRKMARVYLDTTASQGANINLPS